MVRSDVRFVAALFGAIIVEESLRNIQDPNLKAIGAIIGAALIIKALK